MQTIFSHAVMFSPVFQPGLIIVLALSFLYEVPIMSIERSEWGI